MKDTLKTKSTYQFRTHKSYSAEEILAAGGTSAFARKMGVSGKKQMESLANHPAEDFLTDEETETALKILRENK
jgi:hypothetical protein